VNTWANLYLTGDTGPNPWMQSGPGATHAARLTRATTGGPPDDTTYITPVTVNGTELEWFAMPDAPAELISLSSIGIRVHTHLVFPQSAAPAEVRNTTLTVRVYRADRTTLLGIQTIFMDGDSGPTDWPQINMAVAALLPSVVNGMQCRISVASPADAYGPCEFDLSEIEIDYTGEGVPVTAGEDPIVITAPARKATIPSLMIEVRPRSNKPVIVPSPPVEVRPRSNKPVVITR